PTAPGRRGVRASETEGQSTKIKSFRGRSPDLRRLRGAIVGAASATRSSRGTARPESSRLKPLPQNNQGYEKQKARRTGPSTFIVPDSAGRRRHLLLRRGHDVGRLVNIAIIQRRIHALDGLQRLVRGQA